jgi:hypothetical protein
MERQIERDKGQGHYSLEEEILHLKTISGRMAAIQRPSNGLNPRLKTFL